MEFTSQGWWTLLIKYTKNLTEILSIICSNKINEWISKINFDKNTNNL